MSKGKIQKRKDKKCSFNVVQGYFDGV